MQIMTQDSALSGDFTRYARAGYAAIAVVFGGFGIWASFAPLDSAAIAPARVAVESDRKPVQHLEGGIVREILVKEAQRVEEGQILFRLQPIQAQANTDILRKQLDAALALEARLLAERDGAAEIVIPEAIAARSAIRETATAIADQKRQFKERRRSLDNQIDILKAKIEQTSKDLGGRGSQEAALAAQLASYDKEINAVSPLVEKGFYARNKFLALVRERTRVDGELGLNRGDIARLKESLEEVQLQIRQTTQRFLEDVAQQLADARAKLSDLSEKVAMAEDVLTRVEVRAARAGIVQALKVHAVGAVIRAGDTIAEIVPEGDTLIMAARVSPLDIDSVRTGQKAEVRFPAFSSRQTPTILGSVHSISGDSMVDETTKEPYYLAQVIIDRSTLKPELLQRLVPGMPADVLISRGERTMLAYLLDPLRGALAKSMRER